MIVDEHLTSVSVVSTICNCYAERSTRARAKLVLVGCAQTLTSVPLFAGLLQHMAARNSLHQLTLDAITGDPALAALLPPSDQQQQLQ